MFGKLSKPRTEKKILSGWEKFTLLNYIIFFNMPNLNKQIPSIAGNKP